MVTPKSGLLEEWLSFLRRHRGLEPDSLRTYQHLIACFLDYLGPDATPEGLRRLVPRTIQSFIASRATALGWSRRKMLLSTLRSFLRFAQSRGYLERDLTVAIERIPSWKHQSLPRGPAPDPVGGGDQCGPILAGSCLDRNDARLHRDRHEDETRGLGGLRPGQGGQRQAVMEGSKPADLVGNPLVLCEAKPTQARKLPGEGSATPHNMALHINAAD